MNILGPYVTYDFVITTVLKSHFSASIVNALCIKYLDIVCMAYFLRESWYACDCIFIAHMTPQLLTDISIA